MAKLTARERAELPDSAFAYVDSKGKRRLPINDAAHVRNALARFSQVKFEDEAAREKSRKRLLTAAKRHGIVPVGFITGQLRTARTQAAAARVVIELGRIETSEELESELRRTFDDPGLVLLHWSKAAGSYVDCNDTPVPLPDKASAQTVTFMQGRGRPLSAIIHDVHAFDDPEVTEAVMGAVNLVTGKELLESELDDRGGGENLPDGFVSFVLTDIEGSTELLTELGDRYADVLTDVRTVIRESVLRSGGREVEARADEFVAVFEETEAAVDAAVGFQRELARRDWPDGRDVRVRAGVSSGDIALTESGYVGMTVNIAARVMAAAHGGQILVSQQAAAAISGRGTDGLGLRSLGDHQLKGVSGRLEIFQVEADGLDTHFPPPRLG